MQVCCGCQLGRAKPWAGALIALAIAVVCGSSRSLSNDVVSIEITGEVDALCSLNSLPGIDVGELTASGHRAISFQIDCNAPFEYALHSQKGALATAEDVHLGLGLTTKIPYLVDLRIPTDKGVIDDSCDSATLNSGSPTCGRGNSGEAVAIRQNGVLAISWNVNTQPVAGVYTDTIVLSISPRL